jgi:hypothetical protein
MRHRNRTNPAPRGRCRALERFEIEFTDTSKNRETRSRLQDQKSIPYPIPTPHLAQAASPTSCRQLIVELLGYSPWISAPDVEFLRSIRWTSRLSSQQISELLEIVEAFAMGKPRLSPSPIVTKR